MNVSYPALPPLPPRDTKDWTFVLASRCPHCGYLGSEVQPTSLAERVRSTGPVYADVLGLAGAGKRPEPLVWSPLEYACHVRTVLRLYASRVHLMLEQENPLFEAVDHEDLAVRERFDLQDPARVSAEILEAAEELASAFDRVRGKDWQRTCLKSDGHQFTIESLGRYVLHDIVHHIWDITRDYT